MRTTFSGLMLVVMAVGAGPAQAQSFLAWTGLEAGPHAVGFRSEVALDRARTIHAPTDYLGRPHPAYGARPIEVAVWYPAAEGTSGAPMTFGDYLPLLGWPVGAGAEGARARADADLDFIQTVTPGASPKDQAAMARLSASPVRSRRDARPAPGRFPVLIYAPGSGYPAFDNHVLFEFLASRGFVVVASPSAGPDAGRFADDRASVDAQARDVEFLVGYAQGLPQADPERVAAAGFSGGGVPAVLAAIRHRRIKALVSLDGTIAFGPFLAEMKGHPDFDPRRLRVPVLLISRAAGKDPQGFGDRSFIDQIVYADRVEAVVSGVEHHDLASMSSLLRRAAVAAASRDWRAPTAAYEELSRLILGFLGAALAPSPATPASLDLQSTAHVTVSRTRAKAVPATPEDFQEVRAADGFARAAALVRQTRTEHPEALAPFEVALVRAGYEELAAGRVKEAVALFELCVEVLPGALNGWDSLGEGYLAAGNLDGSERCYREVIRRLDADPAMPGTRRAAFSESARRGLEAVEKKRHVR